MKTFNTFPSPRPTALSWRRVFITAALGCAVHMSTWADTALDSQMISMLGLENFKTIQLIDENGKKLTMDEFKARMNAKATFNMVKNSATSIATLTINGSAQIPESDNQIDLAVGSEMPALKLTDTKGRTVTWNSLGARPVVLNFFFADCPPCIQEVPELNAFAKSHPNIAVLSVTYESQAVTQKFISRRGLQWPAVTDGRAYIEKLGVKSYPTLLLVSPERTLLAVKTGGIAPSNSKDGTTFSFAAWVQNNLKKGLKG